MSVLKRFSIPPHIAWPALIIGLIVGGMVTSLSVVFASRSDGGAAVVDGYYAKALAWDEVAALRAESEALGWTVGITLTPHAGNEALTTVRFTVRDQDGAPLSGLQGQVDVQRPQHAQPLGTVVLTPAEQEGVYEIAFPVNRRGLWDFHLHLTRMGAEGDAERFVSTHRYEVP